MEKFDRKPIIVVENLTARFGSNTIFQNVGFEVYEGEIFVILGGSGCGKSTLMKHMIGLYETESGKVMIHGVDITKADEGQLKKIRLEIAVGFRSGGLFGSST